MRHSNVHCTWVRPLHFIPLLSSHIWFSHSFIHSIVCSFVSRLIGSIFVQIVTSQCGWHALFRLTLLSFDCNFIQKIRFSILYFLLWCLCAIYTLYDKIKYILGFLVTCRGVVQCTHLYVRMFVWISFDGCFYSVFNCGLLSICVFLYLILPFVQGVLVHNSAFYVESEKVITYDYYLTNTRIHMDQNCNEIKHYIATDGRLYNFEWQQISFHINCWACCFSIGQRCFIIDSH